MGDAVRRVQKHLQELSRDHLTSVEDRHHANLGWLQIEFQKLCKQIEVDVRVELTRPPRLSFSKPNALLPAAKDIDNRPKVNPSATAHEIEKKSAPVPAKAKTPPLLPSPVHMKATRLVFDETEEASPRVSKKRRLEDTKKVVVDTKKEIAKAQEVIEIDADSDIEVVGVVAAPSKHTIKRMVKRKRTVLKPKKIVKTEKKFVKEEKPVLPQVDVNVLKVVDLKSELKQRGLKQTGVKAVLVQRLQEALDAEDAAQAQDDEEAGTWVTEEIIEEVMEEVEEEYEEEIEEEVPEHSANEEPKVTESKKTSAAESAIVSTEPASFHATESKAGGQKKVVEVAQKESARMTLEDVNASSTGNEKGVSKPPTDKLNKFEETTKMNLSDSKPSPKKSLSDMVSPKGEDEIVRESADGFVSPEGKLPSTTLGSSLKSSDKKAQPATTKTMEVKPVTAPAKPSDAPSFAIPTAPSVSDREKPTITAVPGEKENPFKRPETAPTEEKLSIEKSVVSVVQQTSKPAVTRQAQEREDKIDGANTSKTVEVPYEQSTSIANATGTVRSSDNQKASTASDTKTPSRDLLERVKSLTSSSRSSSISSFSAARRYTGSVGYVEDSQPDQSPYRPPFSTDFSAQTTRAVSTSRIEINIPVSKAKTPEPTAFVPPPSERVAQSEPRLYAAKTEVEDEAERKRREEQENIQREAQRLRLAMKQSARKRFEESKTTSLFWKRDQTKTESPTDVSPVAESGQPDISPLSATASTSSSLESGQSSKQVPVDGELLTKPSSVATKPASTKMEASAKPVLDTTQLKSSAIQPAPNVQAQKKEQEKLAIQTRKRSSIVLDTSKSTLYPSKKRASISRVKEVEATAKRTSLTKSSAPAETISKRSSTERAPARPDVPKRKRSSEPGERPTDTATANKRGSVLSNQVGKPGARGHAVSSTSAPQKVQAAASKIAAPSATTAKRKDSVSSTISSSSSVSTNGTRAKPNGSAFSGGAVRKPANLVSGLHSFTSLLEKESANLSSSQGSTSSSSRQPTNVSALKLAEKSRLLEQKKNLEKAKRKEALAKKYEEQRKADEEKRKKYALMKEKAEREARLKREQEQATEKKQRDLELAKKRQQRLQEMRSGMERKKAQVVDKEQSAVSKTAVPVSRIAGAASSHTSKSVAKAGQAKEVTTYVMSENEESSESEDEKDTKRNSKNIPKWAQRENLERTLRIQFGPNAIDPTPTIFPDFVDSCDLEAIFEPTDARKKKRFQRRTSSGNWLGDRPTAREKAVYKKDMGFQR